MLNFYSLYSGSSGNSLCVQTEHTNILIDSGVSSKKIEKALEHIEINPNSIDAILVTHEHTDHVQGLGTFSRKFDIPVFANKETFDSMPAQTEKIKESNQKVFNIQDNFWIGDLLISPFSIPHDAANPCGFNVMNDKKKISIATDIGHMNSKILKKLEGSDFLLLEANYEPEVLKCSKYPFSLKTRIAGPTGHLSNEMAGKTISYLAKNGLKSAMLGHLSKENNFPELAYKSVLEQLIEEHYDENSFCLQVANRNSPSPAIEL